MRCATQDEYDCRMILPVLVEKILQLTCVNIFLWFMRLFPRMSEYDCRMILPVLVEKAGHNQVSMPVCAHLYAWTMIT